MKGQKQSSVMMRVEKIVGEDAVVVTIPAWRSQQKIVIPIEFFPPSLKSETAFPIWYFCDIHLPADSFEELNLQNMRETQSPIPGEEFAL